MIKNHTRGKMFGKKLKLAAIVASAVGIFGLAGCKAQQKSYWFEGKLGEEKVKFWEDLGSNYLKVVRPDGKKIEYIDLFTNDLHLEEVRITIKGEEKIYTRRDHKLIVEEAQTQFNEYLQKILKIKQKDGLDQLKKDQQEGLELLKKEAPQNQEETKENKQYKEEVYNQ